MSVVLVDVVRLVEIVVNVKVATGDVMLAKAKRAAPLASLPPRSVAASVGAVGLLLLSLLRMAMLASSNDGGIRRLGYYLVIRAR